MYKNSKGQAVIALLVLLFVFVIGLFGFIYFTKMKENPKNDGSMNRSESKSITLDDTESSSSSEYTTMEESTSTPKEVDNTVVNELDSLMKDIDSTSEEDLSDLDL